MSRRCNLQGKRFVQIRNPWVRFQHRTIGEMVRQAREDGVLPDMDSTEGAFDEDKDANIDPYANPTTDPMDLMNEGLLTETAAMKACAKAAQDAAKVAETSQTSVETQPKPEE